MKFIVKIHDKNSAYCYCVYTIDEVAVHLCTEGLRIFESNDREEFLKLIGGNIHQLLSAWDKAPKKEHRNSKLARRIKATEKVLKDLYASDTHLLRIMTENQLALMERILETDREKGVVIQ